MLNPNTAVGVLDFNADPSGSTSSTSQVLACINAVPSGSTVYFPYGTYDLSSWTTATISKNLTFKGDPGTKIIGPSTTGHDYNFLSLSAGYSLYVENLWFENFHGVVRLLTAAQTHKTIEVKNCDFNGCEYAVYDAGLGSAIGNVERLVFAGNRVHGTLRSVRRGIVVRSIDHNYVLVEHNQFDDIDNDDIAAAIWIGDSNTTGGDFCSINCNKINGVNSSVADTDSHGIFIYSATPEITGNRVEGITNANDGENCEGIYMKSSAPSVTKNHLVNAGSEAAIYFKGSLSVVEKGGVITGNRIRNTTGTLVDIGGRGGYGIATVNPCVIRGNDIDGFFGGVYASGCDGLSISGNRIRNLESAGTVHGARIEDSSNVCVEGNVVSGLTSTAGGTVYGVFIRRAVAGTSVHTNISGNIITDGSTGSAGEAGIHFQTASGQNITGVKVSSNQVANFKKGISANTVNPEMSGVLMMENHFINCSVANYDASLQNIADLRHGEYLTGSGNPLNVVTPEYVGERYLDTATNNWYRSDGLTDADWSTD